MRKILLLILFFGCLKTQAQQNNPFRLVIINDLQAYKTSLLIDKNKELIEIKKFIPNLKLDIRYAITKMKIRSSGYMTCLG